MIPCSKRRRVSVTRNDAGKRHVDWASLDQDLVELIGCRVLAGGDLQDYVWFRAVCSQWSANTVRPRGRGVLDPRFHPRRWMMLPEGHGLYPGHPDLRGFLRFFNLSTGAFAQAHLPLLADHVILDSVDGLLVLHRDHDTAIRLLHPFTGDVAEFPPLDSLLPQMEPVDYGSERGKRARLMKFHASVAVSSSGAITLMLALDQLDRVAYATAGDRRWALSSWKLTHLLRPISFQGKLYALQSIISTNIRKVYIYQINPPSQDADEGQSRLPLPVKIAECPSHNHILNFVECSSELYLVSYNDNSRSKLLVYRLTDLVSGKFQQITDIGDHTLFIDKRSLCVSLPRNKWSKSFPSMLPANSIICMHTSAYDPYSEVVARFEQYDLSTGTWAPASDGDIFQRPPPNPHTLIHHVFTCCDYLYWNKGLMYCCKTLAMWLVKGDLRYAA